MDKSICLFLLSILLLLNTSKVSAQPATATKTTTSPTIIPTGYTLHIPEQYMENPDFKYGLARINDVPAYTRDVFEFRQYALVWRTKAASGYFKYANKESNVFEPTENPNNPVGFLIAYRNIVYEEPSDARTPNIPIFDITWTCRPSNTQQEYVPLVQVFKDIMREKVGNSGGKLNTRNLHLIMPNSPNPDDPRTTKILLWNKSSATDVSFDPDRPVKEADIDSTYRLFIPLADLTQTDFNYGLKKGELVSSDKMAYTYFPVFYNNNKQYYFKYHDKKTMFAANRNVSDSLGRAFFVMTFLGNGIEPNDLDFRRVPGDRQSKIRSLSKLFIDCFKNIRKETIKKVQLIYDIEPDIEEERLNRIALWNDSQVVDITFDVPDAYYYIDMSKTIDRDVLIKILEEEMDILDKENKSFVAYISNGETPLIAEDIKAFRQILLRLWTLSPPTPSVGFDGETLKAKIGPDIEFLAQNDVDFHFYASDNLCSNSLNKLINSILSTNAHEKTNVYVRLEAQDEEGNTYFSKCKYQNTGKELKPSCLKPLRDKNVPCECK